MPKRKSPPRSLPQPPAAPDSTLSLHALAAALGVDRARIRREAKRGGFPSVMVSGKRRFVAADVRSWRAANINSRKVGNPVPPTPPPDGATTSEPVDLFDRSLANADDPFIKDMMSGSASALTISRAAMQMASRRVAMGAVSGRVSTNDFDGLKKTLSELRSEETNYIDTEKARRALIARDEVIEIVGSCCARLVQCVERIENTIATEFSLWLADEKVRAMGQDQRARVVREFVKTTCNAVRAQEAQDVRKLIDAKRDGDDEEVSQ